MGKRSYCVTWLLAALLIRLPYFCADEARRRSDGSGQYTPLSRQESSDSHHGTFGRLSTAAMGRVGAAVERRDSVSSIESRSSVSERSGSKHSRKSQQVHSGRKSGEESRGRSDSLSISVDWGALPCTVSLSNGGGGLPHVDTPSGHAHTGDDVGVSGQEAAPSTLVSLPLLYSARADSAENVPTAPPYPSSADLASQKPAASGEFPGNPAGSQPWHVEPA